MFPSAVTGSSKSTSVAMTMHVPKLECTSYLDFYVNAVAGIAW